MIYRSPWHINEISRKHDNFITYCELTLHWFQTFLTHVMEQWVPLRICWFLDWTCSPLFTWLHGSSLIQICLWLKTIRWYSADFPLMRFIFSLSFSPCLSLFFSIFLLSLLFINEPPEYCQQPLSHILPIFCLKENWGHTHPCPGWENLYLAKMGKLPQDLLDPHMKNYEKTLFVFGLYLKTRMLFHNSSGILYSHRYAKEYGGSKQIKTEIPNDQWSSIWNYTQRGWNYHLVKIPHSYAYCSTILSSHDMETKCLPMDKWIKTMWYMYTI